MKTINELINKYDELISELSNIAESEDTTAEDLLIISSVDDRYIQTCVITNPNTPSSYLEKSLDMYCGVGGIDEEIRIHIIHNPSLSRKSLLKISKEDPSYRIREIASSILLNRKILD